MKSAAKERREDIMAFSKEHRRIAELKNIERHHGFMDVDDNSGMCRIYHDSGRE